MKAWPLRATQYELSKARVVAEAEITSNSILTLFAP